MPGGGLDALKSLLQQKKAEKQELVGAKKYVRKSELEEAKLKRIREEEDAERRAKVIHTLSPAVAASPPAACCRSHRGSHSLLACFFVFCMTLKGCGSVIGTTMEGRCTV